MASVTLSPVVGWTVGETISAYVRDVRNVAVGSAVATAVVASDSTTTFTGLDVEQRFIATDGSHEVRFGTHTDPDPAQSGSAGRALYDPATYGAKYDGTTDDSAAIQAAIDAASLAGGGIVEITGTKQIQGTQTGATVVINSTLQPKPSVHVRGRGAATALSGTANPMIGLPTSGVTTDRIQISDLLLQSPAGVGILLDTTGLTGGYQLGWPRVTIENVTVVDGAGDSFKIPTSAVIEARLINCVSLRAGGHGFNIDSTDQFIVGCTAAQGSADGFLMGGANNKLSACKGYGNASGVGINLQGAGRHVVSGCETQDNKVGYVVNGSWNYVEGLADTNLDAGVRIYGNDNTVNVVCMYGGGGSGFSTKVGFDLAASFGSAPARNRVRGVSNCLSHVGGYTSGNDIDVRNGRDSIQTVAYAATITPDPYLGGTVAVTLTGDVAINAPTSGTFIGQRLRFILTEDSTGSRTTTFATAYRTNWTPDTAAGKTNIIEFVFGGRYWQQVNSTTGLTASPAGISDSFTRADSGTLGTATTGQAWSNLIRGIGIVSNQASAGTSTGTFQDNLAVIDAAVSDCTLSVKVVANPAPVGLVVRATDANNYWLLVEQELRKIEGGSTSVAVSQSINPSSGDIVTVQLVGPTIMVFKNGALAYTYSSPFNMAATKHGIYISHPSCALDDFSVS